MNVKLARKYAIHVSSFQRYGSSYSLMGLPTRLMANPAWREKHLHGPSLRIHTKSVLRATAEALADPHD